MTMLVIDSDRDLSLILSKKNLSTTFDLIASKWFLKTFSREFCQWFKFYKVIVCRSAELCFEYLIVLSPLGIIYL